MERRVGVEVDHWGRAAVGGREEERIDRDLALLQVPVGPHGTVRHDLAARRPDVDRVGLTEERPEPGRPRARRDHDLLADLDRAVARLDGGDRVVAAEAEARDLGVREDRHTFPEALVAQPEDGVDVEGEPALVLVQADRDSLRAPVGEEPLHVRVHLGGSRDQLRPVPDPLLPLIGCGQVFLLDARAERDVADGVVGVRDRIGLPHLHARLHELAHRRLEVVVADDAAGDPARTRARRRLVEDDDVRARAGSARSKLLREVVRGRESVDPGADHDVRRASGDRQLLPRLQHRCGHDYADGTTPRRAAPPLPRGPSPS